MCGVNAAPSYLHVLQGANTGHRPSVSGPSAVPLGLLITPSVCLLPSTSLSEWLWIAFVTGRLFRLPPPGPIRPSPFLSLARFSSVKMWRSLVALLSLASLATSFDNKMSWSGYCTLLIYCSKLGVTTGTSEGWPAPSVPGPDNSTGPSSPKTRRPSARPVSVGVPLPPVPFQCWPCPSVTS